MNIIQTKGFADMHTHILPGADDGAQNMADALRMVRMAWNNGTRAIMLTPHYRGTYKKNAPQWHRENFDIFRQMVADEFPDMELYLGSEAHYEVDLPDRVMNGDVMTLNDSRYILLEFSSISLKSRIITGVSDILSCGLVPIVAHADRYEAFRSSEDLVDEILEMGALIQLNADSVLGKHGAQIHGFCHRLLKEEKVHFIASDAHDVDSRPPQLRDCFLSIHKKYGREYAAQVFCNNARAVIDNRRM